MFNLAVIQHFLLHYKIINTISTLRSSRPEVFCKKGVLRKFGKFLGKHLCQSLSFNKVAVEFWENFKNIFFHRTPLVAASLLYRNGFLFFFTTFSGLLLKPGPGPWTQTLDPGPGPGPWNWTLDPDPEKPGP